MHVTFLFAFSSRYAKTRTYNFCNVVRQHTEVMVGSIIWIFLDTSLSSSERIFKKSVKNWKNYCHEFGVLLFWNTVYNGDL